MTPPSSLQQQLLSRVQQLQKNFPTITQSDIARHCGIGESNFSAAIAGRRGLSANSCLKLHTLLSLPRNEVIKKFSQPVRTSRILNLQQSVEGQPARMQLDNDGNVPGQSGVDPNDAGQSIDNTPDADTSMSTEDTIATLRQVRSIHRKAIRAINSWILSNKVNEGSTAPTSQRFSTRNIQKTLRFAANDSSAATKELLTVLGSLDMVTRQNVILAILKAFPH
jgi:hypothetical protein